MINDPRNAIVWRTFCTKDGYCDEGATVDVELQEDEYIADVIIHIYRDSYDLGQDDRADLVTYALRITTRPDVLDYVCSLCTQLGLDLE